jgi:hypothetical protein
MPHLLIALLLALSSGAAVAEGPGTRIRAGSDLTRLLDSVQRNAWPCDRQRGEARDRCLREIRRAAVPERGAGPQRIGSGAGSGASGGAPSGAAAPR